MRVILTLVHVLGLVCIVFGCLMTTCLLTSFFSNDGVTQAFWDATKMTFALGLVMFFSTFKIPKKLSRQAGFLLVAMTWSLSPMLCTLPLLFAMPDITFVDAYFEMMSSLTTTGASTLSGIDNLPMSINLWRHELTWIAGLGIIIFAVAILPMLGIGGMQLYKAEAPGSVKESDLPPRIAQTAKALWIVYAGLSIVCLIALKIAGMTWFDAVCHTFSAMSLGGLSTHDSSIGFFNSVPIEIVLTTFQLIAAINLATHFVVIRKKSFRPYLHDMEARGFLTLVLGSCVLAATVLYSKGTYPDFWTALRHASFNVVTIATTSGYASQDFNQWPIFVPIWMLFLSCLSASSGSTGGGIRMIRTIILIKQARLEMFKFIHPFAIRPMKMGDTVVNNNIITSVMGFIFLYFICIVALIFALLLTGLDFLTSFSAVIACFNNAGPGLNQVGPAANYASLTDIQTMICTFAMLLGRVQIFSIVILFIPEFWRK